MALPLAAQFQAPLEADSPEEFDLYLTVEDSPDVLSVLRRCDAFLAKWPNSALLPRVWELRYFALRKLGKADEARAAGEQALRLAPNNLAVRGELAIQLASVDGKEAESLAKSLLAELDTIKVRRSIPLEKVERTVRELRVQAKVALGVVYYRRGETEAALRELESAVGIAPGIDAALHLRLGRLYASLGRTAEARTQLETAAKAGNPEVARLARDSLAALP